MIRRPPRSTLDRSSAASDVYKRQGGGRVNTYVRLLQGNVYLLTIYDKTDRDTLTTKAVSYTHLRAHETVLDLVCRLLLETKKHTLTPKSFTQNTNEVKVELDITMTVLRAASQQIHQHNV